MNKIRFKTWYWGKWIYEGSILDGSRITLKTEGFEPYIEELHGLHNSEEFNKGVLKCKQTIK